MQLNDFQSCEIYECKVLMMKPRCLKSASIFLGDGEAVLCTTVVSTVVHNSMVLMGLKIVATLQS